MRAYEQDALDAYERAGERYDRQTAAFKDRIAYPDIAAMLTERLGSLAGKTLLDVGCGSGGLVEALEKTGAICRGIDLSPSFIARGTARGLPLMEGSMLALPYADQSFDAAVSFHSLNYLPYEEQGAAVAEQWRVLRPGGTVLAACFFALNEVPGGLTFSTLGEAFRLYPRPKESLEKLFGACGFLNARALPVTAPRSALTSLLETARDEDEVAILRMASVQPYALIVTGTK
ncbi:MAG: class I SAM-dependent methyltransferase [bacterium]